MRVQLPRRSKRRLHQIQAAAEKRAFSNTRRQRLALQVDRPALLRFRNRPYKAFSIVSVRSACASIEARRNHRAVNRDPPKFLPQKNMQRSDIAETAK